MSSSQQDAPPIFTIGYGPRSFDQFLDLLKTYEIEYLLDVRSSASSRREAFSKEGLRRRLSDHEITYAYFGNLLGGRPKEDDCYQNGHVVYNRCRSKPWFQEGIKRLQKAHRDGYRVALMCSEIRPEECHRSKMVGVGLADLGLPVMHIDEKGLLAKQTDVLRRLDSNMEDLFDDAPDLGYTSRKAYR